MILLCVLMAKFLLFHALFQLGLQKFKGNQNPSFATLSSLALSEFWRVDQNLYKSQIIQTNSTFNVHRTWIFCNIEIKHHCYF